MIQRIGSRGTTEASRRHLCVSHSLLLCEEIVCMPIKCDGASHMCRRHAQCQRNEEARVNAAAPSNDAFLVAKCQTL